MHVHILYITNICFKNKNIYIYIVHMIYIILNQGISQQFITAADVFCINSL